MWVLTLGECGSATRVQRVLEGLHARRPVSGLLVDHACPTDAAVYCWSTHRTVEVCPVWTWPGVVAVQRGERPPVFGIDRARALLADARGVAERVLVWGPVLAFGEDRKRRRHWDVPAEVVVAEAQAMGWSGWRLLGEVLVAFPAGQ
ncbi:MAG: hypothetical protein R3F60_14610 [bacterium]